MLYNYLKIAIRNLINQKLYTLINIVGLSIGMACTILIMIWITQETSYNKFNKNIDNIFVVPQIQKFQTIGEMKAVATPLALAPSIKNENPEIKHATRYVYFWGKSPVSHGIESFNQVLNLADPDFFKMFEFEFIQGDKNTVLEDRYSVVITEKTALKYFGNKNPIGEELRVRNKVDLKVTGVIKDIPHNSDLTFDMISSSEILEDFNYNIRDWGMNMLITFVELHNQDQAPALEKRIEPRIKKEIDAPTAGSLFLFPFSDFHLYSYSFSGMGEKIETIYIFGIIAFFILIIACINFTNLATARSVKRSKEVGIRKVIGVRRFQIALQFFGESVFLTSLSLLLAFILVEMFIPLFNDITGHELNISQLSIVTLLIIIGITLITGVLSGIYPAIIISSFKPISILKQKTSGLKSRYALQQILVVFQFTISIMLIIGTSVIYMQTQYIFKKDWGMEKDNVIYLQLSDVLRNNAENLKTELSKKTGILSASISSAIPTDIFVNSGGWSWEGKDPQLEELVSVMSADEDLLETYGMQLSGGRFFSKDFAGDNNNSILINESFSKIIGDGNPIGKNLRYVNNNYNIIGVIKDFSFAHIKKKIGPLVVYSNSFGQYLSIKLVNADLTETLEYINNECKKIDPGYVFDYEFLDNTFARIYNSELKLSKVLNIFTLLAMTISCLGLLGLVSSVTEMKTKEIGIRRVMGASIGEVILLLLRNFTKWILIAGIIACPLGLYFMNGWLDDFAYRVDISWWIFVLSGGMSLLIALFVISFQVIKAATANPINSLKYE